MMPGCHEAQLAELEPHIQWRFVRQACEIRRYGQRICGDIISIGTVLHTVKADMPHGQWLPWLRAEFNWGEATAQRFMRVAEAFRETHQP
jgi:hypothetical protein